MEKVPEPGASLPNFFARMRRRVFSLSDPFPSFYSRGKGSASESGRARGVRGSLVKCR